MTSKKMICVHCDKEIEAVEGFYTASVINDEKKEMGKVAFHPTCWRIANKY